MPNSILIQIVSASSHRYLPAVIKTSQVDQSVCLDLDTQVWLDVDRVVVYFLHEVLPHDVQYSTCLPCITTGFFYWFSTTRLQLYAYSSKL